MLMGNTFQIYRHQTLEQLFNIPYHISLNYLINVILYKTCYILSIFVNGDRHIFPQKTHVVGKTLRSY